ncbi:MAG: filamentous hemagglutinin N-terminal domain-containing protein [Parachlamydiales bacterium]|nr:filamentous hemagglutinin N-terminal domain-containing protein [Parachlamydiales bacterium]
MRIFILSCFVSGAFALPTAPSILEGDVQIQFEERSAEIQTGSFANLNWESFSIEPDESVRFLQNGPDSIAINRVISHMPSQIFGQLKSNGQIVLINPNGVVIGENAMIDTGGLLASTLDQITNIHSKEAIINEGIIRSSGDVLLMAQHVVNRGAIEAQNTFVGIGREIEYQEKLFIHPSLDHPFDGLGFDNSGTIVSKNIEIKADGTLYSYAISHSGTFQALEKVIIESKDGYSRISGAIYANEVQIVGSRIAVLENSQIHAPEGEIFLSGDYVYIDKCAALCADSKLRGDGGKITIWGSDVNAMYGTLSAKGGPQGGNGGFVEISGLNALFPKGPVDTSAPFGKNGTLLFDPCVVTISTAATSPGVTPTSPPPACPLPAQNYAFTGLAAANILNTDISGYLACNDVTIDASASGTAGSGSITLDPGALGFITWNTTSKLTLIADGFIQINNRISAMGAVSATTPLIEIDAPIVQIGPSVDDADIVSVSGQIRVNSPTSLSIFSSNMPTRKGIYSETVRIRTGSLLLSATTAPVVIQANTNIDIQATANIQLQAGNGGVDAEAQIVLLTPGTNTITGSGNLTLLGGLSATSGNAVIANFMGGDLTVNIAGDIQMQSGLSPTDGVAGIAVQNGTGSVSVSARDITLNAAAGAGTSFTVIGTVSGGDAITTVTATGPNGITQNAATNNFATIGSPSGFGGSGVTIVNTTNLTLNAAATGGVIGDAKVFSTNANVTVRASGDIIAHGGIGGMNNQAGIISDGVGALVDVSARNISLFGGSGTGSLGIIHSRRGALNVAASGDLLIQAGSGLNSGAAVGSATVSGSGNLQVTARNITLIGGSAPFCIAGMLIGNPVTMGAGNGSSFITATGSINMIGGSGATALANISTNGTLLTNALTVRAGSNINMTAGTGAEANIFTLGGPISIFAGNDMTMTSGSFESKVYITAGSSELFIQTGRNLSVNSRIQHLGTGDVILVVDANFPRPLIGPGRFTLGPTSIVTTTTGALRVFTALQPLNSILGTLNGLTFIPGALFVDTTQEIWCTYYPSLLGGFPYTIFYKNCLQQLAYQSSVIATASLVDLQPFDAFPGWWERFKLSSALDDMNWDSPHFITHRHSSFVWLPKSYTHWLHDEL